MKYKTTKKNIRNSESKIISVGYCNLQNLLSVVQPFAYSSGTYGWACDYYTIPHEICVSTGYSPIGKEISYDFCRKYDKRAEQIRHNSYNWDGEVKPALDALLEEFSREIEKTYFTKKRR